MKNYIFQQKIMKKTIEKGNEIPTLPWTDTEEYFIEEDGNEIDLKNNKIRERCQRYKKQTKNKTKTNKNNRKQHFHS